MAATASELRPMIEAVLKKRGASAYQAGATAEALPAPEASGLPSHGLSRVAMYVAHLQAGRVYRGLPVWWTLFEPHVR